MWLLDELKRRNVFRVAIAYVLLGWAVLQGADFLLDLAAAPEWVIRVFAIAGLVGFPFALFFAWAYELTPEGIKREKNVDRSTSITRQTGRKLNRLIIAFLVVAVGLLLLDRFCLQTGRTADANGAAEESRSIAVLPFVNLSDDRDHFADGLSEELLNLLAKSPDLKVAGRTSSFAFKGRNEDLREIGEALGVEHVLEGSVRRSGERLRITAQLVEVDDGFHVWSDTYDRQMADIFDIQDDVAGAITDALSCACRRNPTGQPQIPRPTRCISRQSACRRPAHEARPARLSGCSIRRSPWILNSPARTN
jgi:TolB-like protein